MDPLEYLRLARDRLGQVSNSLRVILNSRSAESLASMKRRLSASMTAMASGAWSTSER